MFPFDIELSGGSMKPKKRATRAKPRKDPEIRGAYYIVDGKRFTQTQWVDEIERLARKAFRGVDIPTP